MKNHVWAVAAASVMLVGAMGCGRVLNVGENAITACESACGVGCQAPGATCYSDGQRYCNDCVADCHGAAPVACVNDAGAADAGDHQACIAACGVGCQAPGSACYSDGQSYCSDCAAACSGASRVTCAARDAGAVDAGPADGGAATCVSACGVGCHAPGSVCYSDGQEYCSDCAASCYGASRVTCGAVDAGPAPDAGSLELCIASCGLGCQAPGTSCYSDGREYCSDCVAACYGASRAVCGPHDGGGAP